MRGSPVLRTTSLLPSQPESAIYTHGSLKDTTRGPTHGTNLWPWVSVRVTTKYDNQVVCLLAITETIQHSHFLIWIFSKTLSLSSAGGGWILTGWFTSETCYYTPVHLVQSGGKCGLCMRRCLACSSYVHILHCAFVIAHASLWCQFQSLNYVQL